MREMAQASVRPCVFGLATRKTSLATKLEALAAWLGEHAGVPLEARTATSYDQLARWMREGAVEVAWLPPIVFVHLEREGIAMPLVSNYREGLSTYHAALIVHAKSKIHVVDGIRGSRAVWVDPHSAAGFVLPRIQLAALGIDPRHVFAEERFAGSHEAVVRAIVEQTADVGATYANVNEAGLVLRGGWSDVPGMADQIRVLATFGSIPGDLVGVRVGLDRARADAIARAFVDACKDPVAGPLAREVLGVEECRVGGGESYGVLRRAVADAAARGLLDDLGVRSGSMRP
jgi:phosphonate transport system substrate-binding protein